MNQPAFFFDRDGVVNIDPDPQPYVLSWEQWVWAPGLFALLGEIKRRGFTTVLVTSQRCVGKGLLGEAALAGLHGRMQEVLGDLAFDAIYVHTGLPGDPVPPKPDPGMVWAAVRDLGLDLSRSWLIGDADRDMAMAQAAGVAHTIRVNGFKPVGVAGDHEVRSLAEVHGILEARLGPGPVES
ncbi:MAG: HAD-IIIA family hydrolase [Verrucomicrobia bacterium]|nr:HAD-IIIA family hydrolase [Verrucomicrobiota bacterium]